MILYTRAHIFPKLIHIYRGCKMQDWSYYSTIIQRAYLNKKKLYMQLYLNCRIRCLFIAYKDIKFILIFLLFIDAFKAALTFVKLTRNG